MSEEQSKGLEFVVVLCSVRCCSVQLCRPRHGFLKYECTLTKTLSKLHRANQT